MDEENKKNEEKNLFFLTVKAVILNNEEKTLILKRPEDEKTGAGKYDLAGGDMEAGEKIIDALMREVKEETGLEVEIGPVVHMFDFEKKNKDGEQLNGKGIRFLAFCKNDDVKLDEKEHSGFEWLEIDEAIKKLSSEGFEKDKREAVIKAKEYLALKDSLNGWKRCQADFENYKKRQAESQKDLLRYSLEGIIMQILPVLDNFHASTDHIPEDQKSNAWVVGIMHIQKQLEDLLKVNEIEEIEAKIGDEFNPAIHEAVADANLQNKSESTNKISKVIQKGYKIGGKVIRPTRVVVE